MGVKQVSQRSAELKLKFASRKKRSFSRSLSACLLSTVLPVLRPEPLCLGLNMRGPTGPCLAQHKLWFPLDPCGENAALDADRSFCAWVAQRADPPQEANTGSAVGLAGIFPQNLSSASEQGPSLGNGCAEAPEVKPLDSVTQSGGGFAGERNSSKPAGLPEFYVLWKTVFLRTRVGSISRWCKL